MPAVTTNITAANQWTDPICPTRRDDQASLAPRTIPHGILNISVKGTAFIGTIQLQRRFGSADSWKPVTDGEWTGDVETRLDEYEPNVEYRLGCPSFSSGSAAVRLSF